MDIDVALIGMAMAYMITWLTLSYCNKIGYNVKHDMTYLFHNWKKFRGCYDNKYSDIFFAVQ